MPWIRSRGSRRVCGGERGFQQASKFSREIDRYARMHGSLAVKEALRAGNCEHTLVPDIRVDIQACAAVEREGHKFFRRNIVPRERKRDYKWFAFERPEELSAVRVIVGMPQEDAFRRPRMLLVRLMWLFAVPEHIVTSDRRVVPIEDVATPVGVEFTFNGAPSSPLSSSKGRVPAAGQRTISMGCASGASTR